MKRLFAFLLVMCTVFSVCAFSACDEPAPPAHEHTFSTEWTKDKDYHWHVCQEVGCNEVADKKEHTWENDTCTICGQEKEQPVDSFNGEVTKEQWDLAVIAEKFNNVTVSYALVQTGIGEVKAEILIDGDKVYRRMEQPTMNMGFVGEQAKAQKDMVLNLFIDLIAKYETFTYNEQEGVYLSTETVTTTVTDEVSGYTTIETMTNGKVKFNSDYTVEWLTCDMTEEIYDGDQKVHTGQYEDMIFQFKDFGTTVVDIITEVPYIPQENYTQVTEQQWIDSMSVKFDCQIKQTQTLLANGEFYYVMEDSYIRSGNVIKFSDWYISIEGDKYFEYFSDEEGNWNKEEIEEDHYINLATFAELITAYNQAIFDEETGLYLCDEIDIGYGEKYYNLKMGFVEGKLAYVCYEEKDDDIQAVYQCYFEYTTIEVTLPTCAE